jgi:hypothetical protein
MFKVIFVGALFEPIELNNDFFSNFFRDLVSLQKIELNRNRGDWPAKHLYKKADEFLVLIVMRGKGDVYDLTAEKAYSLGGKAPKLLWVDNGKRRGNQPCIAFR